MMKTRARATISHGPSIAAIAARASRSADARAPTPALRAAPPQAARLFLALWPPADVRRALAEARDRVNWSLATRRVATDRLHLTLHFIGEVERDRIEPLREALFSVRREPFEMSFGRFEVWRGGIAVWQSHETPVALRNLHESLGEALAALGFATEQRFRPHVTLARRDAGSSVAPSAPLESLRWHADGFALVESRLGAGGGYGVIQRYA